MKKAKEKSKPQILEETLSGLLELIGITAKISSQEENGIIKLSISPVDTPALLIGYHGKTINALGVFMSLVAFQKFGEGSRVLVDVDSWREKREEKLVSLAHTIAERVRNNGRAEPMYSLTNNERRIVHLALGDQPDITTESVGEGRDRYLVVKPRTSPATIKE